MKITSAESAVMEVLWGAGARDAEEVTAALAKSQAWTETTVRTLLARLVQKKAVEKAKEGRRYLFRPMVAILPLSAYLNRAGFLPCASSRMFRAA